MAFLSSLEHERNEEELLAQVQLLRARLIFRNKVEQGMEAQQTLDGFEI
jgi:hypothetical protein